MANTLVAKRRRGGLRTVFVTAVTAVMVLGTATAASAATSQRIIGSIDAEVWYNAGNHNPAKGRNSFTLKDYGSCSPGVGVWYGGGGYNFVGCGESSWSIQPADVPTISFSYFICRQYAAGISAPRFSCSSTAVDIIT